jgi:glycosyltransferase involved in cell wall biosynthesis
MKVAIIQEWLTTMGGSEKVVQAIVELFPNADLFTLVADPKLVQELGFENKKITTSIIQRLPWGMKKYKTYLPLFPFAIEQFDLSEYDLIISSNHAVSKGVLTTSEQLHVTYCHSPIRYAWDLHHQYLREEGLGFNIKGILARYFLHRIRIWDFISAAQKTSTTIYPPIEIDRFTLETNKEDYYVTSSRMVPYKKIDLIVEAFSKMPGRRLVVIGDGPDFKKIKAKAGANIEFTGYLKFNELIYKLQKARAFVFAAVEDFGMGGSLETVLHGKTGILFPNQTVGSLMDAVDQFETYSFDPLIIRKHAESFGKVEFKDKFYNFIKDKAAVGWPELKF